LVKISREDKNGVVILRLEGKLLGGPDSDAMREVISSAIEAGKKNVVIDLSKVSLVNSTGVGILIATHTTLKRNEGAMKLLSVAKRVSSVLIISGLMTIFEAYNTEEEAIASFDT